MMRAPEATISATSGTPRRNRAERLDNAAPAAVRAPWLTPRTAYACALFLVAISFALYASRFSAVGRWEAADFDPADYRFVAEYFWHVPFAPDTYADPWRSGWGAFLRTVPFRGVGLGTLYLLVGWLRLGHAPATTTEVQSAGILLATIEKALLAAALFTLFAVIRRRWGTVVALVSLVATAFPSHLWRFCDDFITEPVARILFLFAFACTIAMSGERSRNWLAMAVAGLFLCATQLKVQWGLAGMLLLPAMLWQFDLRRRGGDADRSTRWRAGIVLCVAIALAPLSVIAVNWIGWRTPRLNPGIGIHINLRSGGDVLRRYSMAPDGTNAPFTNAHRPLLNWWNIYVGPDVTPDEYEAFDRYAQHYVWTHDRAALHALWEGFQLASTVPGVTRRHGQLVRLESPSQPWLTLIRWMDIVVWALLILGLCFASTRLPCALAAALWVVPAVGNVFSPYELRYHLPMAGIGAAASSIVVAHLLGIRRATRPAIPGPGPTDL